MKSMIRYPYSGWETDELDYTRGFAAMPFRFSMIFEGGLKILKINLNTRWFASLFLEAS